MKKREAPGQGSSTATPSTAPTPAGASPTAHPEPTATDDANVERRAMPPAKRVRKEVSYVPEVTDMMYVFGDVNVRSGTGESAALVEGMVREYTLNLINEAAAVVFKSGGIRITTEHIAFLMRKDPAKLRNLKEFLKYKDIRKSIAAASDDSSSTASSLAKFKEVTSKKPSKSSTLWSWEKLSELAIPGEEDESDLLDDDLLSQPDFESKNRERLRQADEMTKTMSKEEYMKYTEARKASFTYKKAKKFRDWLGPSIAALKLNDDVIEVLGYLAWELVGTITQTALSVKKEMDNNKPGYGNWRHKGSSILSLRLTPDQRDSEKAPLLPVHIREATRRIQEPRLRSSVVGFTASHIHKEHSA